MSWTERDRACIWHPFTQMQTARPPIPILRAAGAYLYGEDGTAYLDGISSWWVNLHGHAHPYIVEKIRSQASTLDHCIFADFTHPGAIELAERILRILPGEMSKIFYSDNGSTSVEVALKMVFQYWHNQNPQTKRSKVISFRGAYHGDTLGAMSAAGKNEFNRPFWPYQFEVESIDPPLMGMEQSSYMQLKNKLEQGNVACFVFEPLVMGSGGMKMYSVVGLEPLLKLCRLYGVLTIADEVMTGFGRTGTLFACGRLLMGPDLICLSKGLTGGVLPLGITACRQHVFEAFLSGDRSKAFLHGHSYTANPISCSAALASLDLLEGSDSLTARIEIEELQRSFSTKWKGHPRLSRCESYGTILAIEYAVSDQASYFHPLRDSLYQFFLERKILLRPLGNVLYVLPPYCISGEELSEIHRQIENTIENFP